VKKDREKVREKEREKEREKGMVKSARLLYNEKMTQ
jgi:hypothetical protein